MNTITWSEELKKFTQIKQFQEKGIQFGALACNIKKLNLTDQGLPPTPEIMGHRKLEDEKADKNYKSSVIIDGVYSFAGSKAEDMRYLFFDSKAKYAVNPEPKYYHIVIKINDKWQYVKDDSGRFIQDGVNIDWQNSPGISTRGRILALPSPPVTAANGPSQLQPNPDSLTVPLWNGEIKPYNGFQPIGLVDYHETWKCQLYYDVRGKPLLGHITLSPLDKWVSNDYKKQMEKQSEGFQKAVDQIRANEVYKKSMADEIALRGDGRDPALIMACDGFKPKNKDGAKYITLLYDHVVQDFEGNTTFISTSKSVDVAAFSALYEKPEGWVYAAQVMGIDVPKWDEATSTKPGGKLIAKSPIQFNQKELAAVGVIPWGNVLAFRKVKQIGEKPSKDEANAQFVGPLYLRNSLVTLQKIDNDYCSITVGGVTKDALMRLFELFGVNAK